MASKELLNMLNEAIAGEIQVSIQYMWQHVQWKGIKAFAISSKLREIAIDEMKHAEAIAERLSFLGGIPTTKPKPIKVGETLEEMLKQDVKDEESTIELYKKIINKAIEEGDITTKALFEQILKEEEEHLDFFTSALEEV